MPLTAKADASDQKHETSRTSHAVYPPEIFNGAHAFAPRALKTSIYSTPHAYEFYSVR
jgi:hypothetical protein